MYVDTHQTNWDIILPFSTYAYNTTRHSTTIYSPFRLVYGRDIVTPLDDLFTSDNAPLQVTTQEFVNAANDTRRLAHNAILKSQDSQAKQYDTTHPQRFFSAGDLVLVWRPNIQVGKSEKLLNNYFGPYKVVRHTSPVNY
jgi:hypothetical protein